MRGVAKTIKTSPAGIAFTAVKRLFNPLPLKQVGLSLVVSVAASLVNLGVATHITAKSLSLLSY